MPAGRPKAKLDLPRGWQKKLIDHYKEGGSDVGAMLLISNWRGKFSRRLFYRWLDDEQEFRDTINEGRAYSEIYWEKIGIGITASGKGNAATWIFNMKNRFKWRDRTEVEVDDKREPAREELEARLRAHGVDPETVGGRVH